VSRFLYVVLDGVGAGALPDAEHYGDVGANTLGNLAALVDLSLPNLGSLGLGCILPLRGVPPDARPLALPGRLDERSAGKDTTAGHWEHMGVVTASPFPTYPEGFPDEVLGPFRETIGRDVLGNKPASGTEIIAELGEEHLRTGRPIVYTSADSVFQIACHVDAIPLEELYRWCGVARTILTGRHAVARVIARPFAGEPGRFMRTKDRRDFSLEPTGITYLDLLTERGVPVLGIGKISQIFAGRGVGEEHKVATNDDNLAYLAEVLASDRQGVIMTNLVDFDMAWGHRNDVDGFAAGLDAVDDALPALLALLGPQDRLLITADHGVDPTTVGTDHTREYVPVLLYPRPKGSEDACYEGTMADTGATLFAHFFPDETPPLGGSPLQDLRPERGWRAYPPVLTSEPPEAGSCGPLPGAVDPLQAEASAPTLAERLGPAPTLAVILGSGLDRLVDRLETIVEIPWTDVPGWRAASVRGHSGTILVAQRPGGRIAVLRGRLHGYEGFDPSELALPLRTLARWGVRRVLLTAAVGSLTDELTAGDLALVREVLDLQSARPGGSPLRLEGTTPALADGLGAPTAVYAAVPGPQYETPAEAALLGHLGADVAGMSVANEVRAAKDEGLETAILAVVTNAAASPGAQWGPGEAAHDEVLAVAGRTLPAVLKVIDDLL
jgi:phosphopentomutase